MNFISTSTSHWARVVCWTHWFVLLSMRVGYFWPKQWHWLFLIALQCGNSFLICVSVIHEILQILWKKRWHFVCFWSGPAPLVSNGRAHTQCPDLKDVWLETFLHGFSVDPKVIKALQKEEVTVKVLVDEGTEEGVYKLLKMVAEATGVKITVGQRARIWHAVRQWRDNIWKNMRLKKGACTFLYQGTQIFYQFLSMLLSQFLLLFVGLKVPYKAHFHSSAWCFVESCINQWTFGSSLSGPCCPGFAQVLKTSATLQERQWPINNVDYSWEWLLLIYWEILLVHSWYGCGNVLRILEESSTTHCAWVKVQQVQWLVRKRVQESHCLMTVYSALCRWHHREEK